MTDKEKLRLIGRVAAMSSPDIGLSVYPGPDCIRLENGSGLRFVFLDYDNFLFRKQFVAGGSTFMSPSFAERLDNCRVVAKMFCGDRAAPYVALTKAYSPVFETLKAVRSCEELDLRLSILGF